MTREEFVEKYIARLNDQQREAVEAVDGAVLLLAVPGSGKTTVLVTRLGYMVYCRGVNPDSILTMTYTVAATGDMKQRFVSLFGTEYANRLEFRTINGVSAKIIQYYSEHHSRRQAFTLLSDEVELTRIIRQIYQAVNDEYAETSLVKDIRTGITFIKNMMLTEEEINGMESDVKNLPEIYRRYQEELRRRRAMDYDDQMCYAKKILESCPPVLEHFQEQYRYLCVDEAQDTSKIQHAIIRLLAQKCGNIFMVGDEDQSIYGFRAAWPDALMNFEQDYPGARILLMERNYRSTEEIVGIANAFISGNRFRREKSMQPTQGRGSPVQTVTAVSRQAQYQYLFHTARNCDTETAALYRNNDSVIPLIDLLERGGVPYNARNFEDTFFSNRLVCDITDIIHFAGNPCDEEIFMRIYYKFGTPISKKAAQWACVQSRQSGMPILEELRFAPDIKGYVRDTVHDLLKLLPQIPKDTASKALDRIWNGLHYGQYAKKAGLDGNKFDILTILAEREADADGLLRRLDELRTIIQEHRNSPENRFILSTIHSSKGLEYEQVYLFDIFDGILPSAIPNGEASIDDVKRYEEERRLYYVAMTRAKRALYLFSCDRVSGFTREIKRFLPREIIDADDVFSTFHQNLCGKTYTDLQRGKGTITAHCGDLVLVEYEDKDTNLLSLGEMFRDRDRTVRYAPAPAREELPPVPRIPAAVPAIPQNAEEAVPPQETPRLSCGMEVVHKIFGRGEVVSVSTDILQVYFPERSETKRFMLDMMFKNRLLTVV